MASVAQIQANRLNAQKSTGPRTAAGKARAAQNALTHGLFAREGVIRGEDREEYEMHREMLLEQLDPVGPLEGILGARVVDLTWRLRRAERLQNMACAALDEGEPEPLLEARHEEWKQLKGSEWDRGLAGVFDEDAALRQLVVDDFAGARVLDRLLMYERRIESSLYRTMAQLRRERQARAAAVGPEEVPRSGSCPPAGQGSSPPAKLASFGADVAPGSPMQETALEAAEPLVGAARDASGPSAALYGQASPEVWSHGQDAHATETPDGVTTNAPAGQKSTGPAQLASFGANGAPASATGRTALAGPGPLPAVGRSTRGQDVRDTFSYTFSGQASPGGRSHGQDAHATETPDGPGSSPGQAPPAKAGVTTNAVEEQSCETKPIGGPGAHDCGLPIADGGLEDAGREQPTLGLAPHDSAIPSLQYSHGAPARPQDKTCETNPISEGPSSWKGQGTSEELKGSGEVRPPAAGHTQSPVRPGNVTWP